MRRFIFELAIEAETYDQAITALEERIGPEDKDATFDYTIERIGDGEEMVEHAND